MAEDAAGHPAAAAGADAAAAAGSAPRAGASDAATAAVDAQAGAAAPPPAALPPPGGGSDDLVVLDVGGVRFELSRAALLRHPDTMLGRMFAEPNRPLWEGKGPHRFPDRDPAVFECVAAFYETGELAPPSHLAHVYRELDFWRVEPPLSPLLAGRAFRGLPLPAYVSELVRLTMRELDADLTALGMRGGSGGGGGGGRSVDVLVSYPPPATLRFVLAVYDEATSPALFARHDAAACEQCAAGGVTHFWEGAPTDSDVSLREVLDYRVTRLRAAAPDGDLPSQVAAAASGMLDTVLAAMLLADNALFRYRLRTALAGVGVEAALLPHTSKAQVDIDFLRLTERLRDGKRLIWYGLRSQAVEGGSGGGTVVLRSKQEYAYVAVKLSEA
jgi:hypothetical protein